jgi:hypothetical protein
MFNASRSSTARQSTARHQKLADIECEGSGEGAANLGGALEALERKTRRKTARDQKLGDVQAPELTSEDGKDDRESACQ